MQPIRTRFAPSPTGYLHVGGARTALFNWLYARHTQGVFLLRIEDTDKNRSTAESVQAIFDGLQWLGIDWDEGPFYQSRRLPLYQSMLETLVQNGKAYYCTCTPGQIEAMREKARAEGTKPRYDGTCRHKNLGPQPNAVIRFKGPESGTTVIDDAVKGPIAFQNSELDDFVLCRSDGMPTYNFVVVVDDIDMQINTIIRGDDHVMNTPKQILLYQALGAELPLFAHVPMVLGDDRTRLSKRHGATSVTAYRDLGLLPDAFINFLARLGWSFGDQEFFSRQELIEKFTIDRIGKSAGVFDPVKLQALNADHIQSATPQALAPQVLPFLQQKGWGPRTMPTCTALFRRCNPAVKPCWRWPTRPGSTMLKRSISKKKPPKNSCGEPSSTPFGTCAGDSMSWTTTMRPTSKSSSRACWRPSISNWAKSLSRCASP
jgi:glutamyl-tRNA synthetase